MSEKGRSSQTAYGWAIRVSPLLFAVGFITTVVGGVSDWPVALRVGSALFLLGVAVWAFANGFLQLSALILAVRRHGWRASFRNVWGSSMFILLMVFFLCLGTCVVLFVVRTLSSGS